MTTPPPTVLDAAGFTRALDDLTNAVHHLQGFVTRRFDEISVEVNATGQMLGMTEESLTGRFGEVLSTLNAISFSGGGHTPHNVGVELDAVVKTTEEAANQILDQADAISRLINSKIDWNDNAARDKIIKAIDDHASNILTACAFQDLTGQRIGQTLNNIRKAESELAETLRRMGLKIDPHAAAANNVQLGTTSHAQSQEEIDNLFK